MDTSKPQYPLTITYNDGETEVIHYENEDCCDLNTFNSHDIDDPKVVLDVNNRRVRLKIVNNQTVICEFID